MKIPRNTYLVLLDALSASIRDLMRMAQCWHGRDREQYYLSELESFKEAAEWLKNQEVDNTPCNPSNTINNILP